MEKTKKIAILGIIGTLVFISIILAINVRLYVGVSEVVNNPDRYDGQEIQLKGIVDDYDGDDDNFYLRASCWQVSNSPMPFFASASMASSSSWLKG